MPALELLGGQATAPGGTITEVTMFSGLSSIVRMAAQNQPVWLLALWAKNQADGTLRVRSPNLHGAVEGLRFDVESADPENLMPFEFMQRLIPQDDLTIEISGSATAGDIELVHLLIYYAGLPGIEGRFMSPDQVKQRMKHIVTVNNTISTGTTGDFSGAEAINAEFDLLKANTDYAILGYLVDTLCGAVRYRGSETGNLGVGGPGNPTERGLTRDWFVKLSRATGLALVPVFNSANEAAFNVDVSQDEDGANPTVTTILAELGS